MRSQEEPDAVIWAEVAWRDEDATQPVQWAGFVQGNSCASVTWDEGRGYQVYINRQYMGHATTAQEAAEEAAAILAEQSGAMVDWMTWLSQCAQHTVVAVRHGFRWASLSQRELRVAFAK